MLYTLIHDNQPTIAEAQGKKINYAAIQNREFFVSCLKQKLADELNAFFAGEESEIDIDRLIEAEIVLRALYNQAGYSYGQFEGKCMEVIDKKGQFDRKYIAFYSDASDINSASSEKTTTE